MGEVAPEADPNTPPVLEVHVAVNPVIGLPPSAGATNATETDPLPVATVAWAGVLGATPTATCPGTASNPEAAAGNVCIYESDNLNTGGVGNNTPSTFGTELFVRSTAAGDFWSEGTWAVTG